MKYIYKIVNDVNNLVYVGQTTCELKTRLAQHFRASKKEKLKNRLLYKAFNEIGFSHFSIELIEVCEDDKGDERESYWIDKYNSFAKGYNQTRGGGGIKISSDKEIIDLYESLQNMSKVAKILGLHYTTVSKILYKNNIQILDSGKVTASTRSIGINQYNLNGEFIQTFKTALDALKWLINEKSVPSDISVGASAHISDVCKGKRKTAYGYKWAYANI